MIAALVVLASLASVARPAQQPACYFPNGDAAPGQLPCHLGGHATCCEEGYACLSNRICKASSAAAVDKGPLYARGACTDRFWESQSCPPFCRTQGYDVMDGQQLMHKCANNDTLFYCESSVKPDCENSKRVIINPSPPVPLTTLALPPESSATAATTTTSDGATATSTGAQLSTATQTTPTPWPEKPEGLSAGEKAGVGVGVGVGVVGLLAAAIMAWVLLKRRKAARAAPALAGAPLPIQEAPVEAESSRNGWHKWASHHASPAPAPRHELPGQ